ncbi:MAG: homoserine dehydrogenase [Clostridia bacterium]|nr:homoserine dehydrogenase [Clostridia bacterium]
MISIAVLGHGVVGSGVAEVLTINQGSITEKVGQPVVVKRILDLRSFPQLPYADKFTTNFDDIVNDTEISIVVETMGGLHPAYDYAKAALSAGKSVVTSNKELVAAKGDELLALAQANNVSFLFEASVGGGIPIIRPLWQCLAANEVEGIAGILNGTTNFMLTHMVQDGMSFEDALALAQQLGYAERNPAADVEGMDACRKICILASLAFGKHVYPDQVHTEGITHLTAADVRCAEQLGCVIKLIGKARRTEDGVYCLVAPMLVPKDSILSGVNDVFNAILVQGNAVGDVVFYGKGAGKLPTASAVVADVIDAAKHQGAPHCLSWEPAAPNHVLNSTDEAFSFLIRFETTEREALSARLVESFGDITVVNCLENELVVVTSPLSEKELSRRLSALPEAAPISCLRIASL